LAFPNLLDFCYLVNPYFPPRKLKDELKANFEILLGEYPSGIRINSLLISKYFHINSDYSVVGNGATELIKSLMENQKGNIGVIYPTFEEYPNRCSRNGLITYIPDNADFSYTADNLMSYYTDKDIQLLLLVNPDNPSGNFISREDVLRLIEWSGQRSVRLVVDESFVDFAEDGLNSSLLLDDILEQYPHLVVMKSISKSYGVPGLRLGILASSDKRLVDNIKKDVSIWNVNSFAEFYMQIFGKYEADYKKSCKRFIQEREYFYRALQKIEYLRVIPSQANYFLCEVISFYTSSELAQILLEKMF